MNSMEGGSSVKDSTPARSKSPQGGAVRQHARALWKHCVKLVIDDLVKRGLYKPRQKDNWDITHNLMVKYLKGNVSKEPDAPAVREKAKEKPSWFRAKFHWALEPFHPNVHWRRSWHLAIFIVVIWDIFCIPFMLSFKPQSFLPIWYLIDYITDAMFVMDMLLSFRASFFRDGNLVIDKREIMLNYFHTWFALDVTASFPVDVLFLFRPRWRAYVRFLRLLRIGKIPQLVRSWEGHANNPQVARLAKLGLVVFCITHIVACCYNGVVATGKSRLAIKLASLPLLAKYGTCLFHAFKLMLGQGTVDGMPRMPLPMEATVICIGVFLFALVIGNITSVIQSLNAENDAFQDRLDVLNDFMVAHRMPQALQHKVKSYYHDLRERTKDWMSFEDDTVQLFPPHLRKEVSMSLHEQFLKRVPIFANVSVEGFFQILAMNLRQQMYTPGDDIIKFGEVGTDMYFISRGTVDVFLESGHKVAEMRDGNVFGEVAVLFKGKRMATIRAQSYVDVYVLSKDIVDQALEDYPECVDPIYEIAEVRLKFADAAEKKKFNAQRLLLKGKSGLEGGATTPTRDPSDETALSPPESGATTPRGMSFRAAASAASLTKKMETVQSKHNTVQEQLAKLKQRKLSMAPPPMSVSFAARMAAMQQNAHGGFTSPLPVVVSPALDVSRASEGGNAEEWLSMLEMTRALMPAQSAVYADAQRLADLDAYLVEARKRVRAGLALMSPATSRAPSPPLDGPVAASSAPAAATPHLTLAPAPKLPGGEHGSTVALRKRLILESDDMSDRGATRKAVGRSNSGDVDRKAVGARVNSGDGDGTAGHARKRSVVSFAVDEADEDTHANATSAEPSSSVRRISGPDAVKIQALSPDDGGDGASPRRDVTPRTRLLKQKLQKVVRGSSAEDLAKAREASMRAAGQAPRADTCGEDAQTPGGQSPTPVHGTDFPAVADGAPSEALGAERTADERPAAEGPAAGGPELGQTAGQPVGPREAPMAAPLALPVVSVNSPKRSTSGSSVGAPETAPPLALQRRDSDLRPPDPVSEGSDSNSGGTTVKCATSSSSASSHDGASRNAERSQRKRASASASSASPAPRTPPTRPSPVAVLSPTASSDVGRASASLPNAAEVPTVLPIARAVACIDELAVPSPSRATRSVDGDDSTFPSPLSSFASPSILHDAKSFAVINSDTAAKVSMSSLLGSHSGSAKTASSSATSVTRGLTISSDGMSHALSGSGLNVAIAVLASATMSASPSPVHARAPGSASQHRLARPRDASSSSDDSPDRPCGERRDAIPSPSSSTTSEDAARDSARARILARRAGTPRRTASPRDALRGRSRSSRTNTPPAELGASLAAAGFTPSVSPLSKAANETAVMLGEDEARPGTMASRPNGTVAAELKSFTMSPLRLPPSSRDKIPRSVSQEMSEGAHGAPHTTDETRVRSKSASPQRPAIPRLNLAPIMAATRDSPGNAVPHPRSTPYVPAPMRYSPLLRTDASSGGLSRSRSRDKESPSGSDRQVEVSSAGRISSPESIAPAKAPRGAPLREMSPRASEVPPVRPGDDGFSVGDSWSTDGSPHE